MSDKKEVDEFFVELSNIEKRLNSLNQKYPFNFSIFLKKDDNGKFFFSSNVEID